MKFKSISAKIISVSVVIISLIMSITGVIDIMLNINKLNNDLVLKTRTLPKTLGISISTDFWDINKPEIKKIIEYFMSDKELYGVTVYEKTGDIYFGIKRNADGEAVEEKLTSEEVKIKKLISGKDDFKKGENVIGSVDVYVTRELVNKTVLTDVLIELAKIILISLLSIIFLYFILDRSLISHIKRIGERFRDMAEGEGDLTVSLDVKSDDEIGSLCGYFNKFIEKLKNLMTHLKVMSNDNKFLGENLSSNSEEVSACINEISSIMTGMTQKMENLNKEVLQVKEAVKSVDDYTQKSARTIEDQSSSIVESSSSIEEMIANLNNITEVTEAKKSLSMELTVIAKDGETGLKNTISAISEITKSAEVIASMINVINNVASQTNLLAMNAAIEAAHAGEFGKGFSVVADEIRVLAETTADNAKNISKSLKTVVGQIKNTQEISDKTNHIIYQLIEGIVEITNSMNEMLLGLKEINIGSSQITSSLNNLIKITEEVKTSSTNLKYSTTDMTNSINEVYDLSSDNKNSIMEISQGINEIGTAIYSLSDLSNKNKLQVENLDEHVAKFKTD